LCGRKQFRCKIHRTKRDVNTEEAHEYCGKTTLAIQLGKALGIRVHHIDKIQFKPGWEVTPSDELVRRHDAILTDEKWIIDGWGGWPLIERRFALADTIIFVDLPIHIHYWWALKRQITFPFQRTPDRPENSPLLPMTLRMLRVLWTVHRHLRPRLIELVEAERKWKCVFRIQSKTELAALRRMYCKAP